MHQVNNNGILKKNVAAVVQIPRLELSQLIAARKLTSLSGVYMMLKA
jgi:hypothetical protein